MIKLAPSILSADFAALGGAVDMLSKSGADEIHVDVMDGSFVPPITFGQEMVRALRAHTALPLDVHLMLINPEVLAESFLQAGADILTVHLEAALHLQRLLKLIRGQGKKAGVALNPATPLAGLEYVLPDVDRVLLMTVNPGYGGQTFIPQMIDKIADLRAMIAHSGYGIDIELDGGVTTANARQLEQQGATILVAGSAVFSAQDPAAVIRTLRGT